MQSASSDLEILAVHAAQDLLIFLMWDFASKSTLTTERSGLAAFVSLVKRPIDQTDRH